VAENGAAGGTGSTIGPGAAAGSVTANVPAAASGNGAGVNAANPVRGDGSPGDMRRTAMSEMMEMAAQSIRRLVVGPADGSMLDADTRRFDELHEAFRAAVDWPAVDVVELRYDGPRTARPFDIALPSRRVTVRAGVGFKPRVVFRPEVTESVADRRMIRLRHCGLSWEGIPVELQLPKEPSEDWALFQLDRAIRVEWADTVLTIREPASGASLPQAAAFVRFAEPVDGERMMDLKAPREMMPTALTLRNCVVRGPAQLVRSPIGMPFRLVWQHGLFASAGGLLDLRGAGNQPAPTEVIAYELSHVTLSIGRPLCSVRLDPDARFPLEFVGKLTQCALVRSPVVGDTAGPMVLFDQICGPGVEPGRFRPYLSGSDNVYPDDTVLLRIAQAGNGVAPLLYTLRERHQAREEKWYDESPAADMLRWRKLPASAVRVDDHVKSDYVLETLDGQPARAGFDPSMLPDS
jgi:hypothetical protein